MAVVQSVMVKNKEYDGVRLTIVGSQSGNQYYNYSEAWGVRNYINEITNPTASLDSVSFNAYLSFTSSGTSMWQFDLIPMSIGDTVMVESQIVGLNSDGSKGYVCNIFGGFRHSGATLSAIGSGATYTTKTDFSSASVSLGTTGTQSVTFKVAGDAGEVIDWNLHIKYTKGFHTLTFGGGGGGSWYPVPPPYEES